MPRTSDSTYIDSFEKHREIQRKMSKGSVIRDLVNASDLEALRLHEQAPKDEEVVDFLDAAIGFVKRTGWGTARKNAGFEGDCRHPWEKVLDMPLKDLIAIRDEVKLPANDDIDDEYLSPIQDASSAGVIAAQREKIKAAHDKLDSTNYIGIKRLAERLTHTDMTGIREWGSQISQARTQAFKDLHDENMSISLQASTRASQILNDLSALVAAQRPTSMWSLKGAFFKARTAIGTPRQKDYFLEEGQEKPKRRKDRLVDYRLMSDEDKKNREDFLLQAMEDGFSNEMGKEEERTVFSERALEVVDVYLQLMRQYQKLLKVNRPRLIEEEKAALSAHHNDGDDELNEQFSRAASRVHDDIDNTIESLQEVIDACASEYDHYITCMALHKENKRKMRGVVNQSIERVRRHARMAQRVMLEQNVMLAGEFAKGLDRYDQEKQIRIATARIRKSMFKEVEELIKIQKGMVRDEAMVLEYKEPVALLEHKKEILALPAPERNRQSEPAPTPEEL